MKKVLFSILFISIFFVLFLYGCCSSANDVFVKISHDSETVYREIVIDEKGRMPRVSFPTGTIIEAPEEMTLQPGIKVMLSEQKLTTENSSVFADSSNAVIYIYKVTAVMESNDPLVSDTKVTTVEKPFSVIIPSDKNLTGISFVGVNEDNTSPWRYFQIPGENNISFNEKSTRNAKEMPLLEYMFSQYRLGSKFALSTYNNYSFDKLPETIVSSLTASTPASILVKDGKYLEDLEINGIMTGSNLGSFKPSDFYARITYRNNSEEVAKIKANGVLCRQTTASDKTVPGKSYVHSFTVSNITEASLMSGEGRFDFKLNLKDIDTELFPSSFLIEFYNKIESEKIYPYVYTEFIDIKKSESVSLTIVSDSRNIIDNSNQIYRCNPSFSITSDYDFSEKDWAKIASAVRVIKQKPDVSARLVSSPLSHGIASNATPSVELLLASSPTIRGGASEIASGTVNDSLLLSARTSEKSDYEYITEGVTKVYQNNKLLIDFNKNLDSDSIYTITMEEPESIEGVTLVPFDELPFKTAEDVVFTISPSEDSIIDSTNQTYSVDPIFYISTNNNYFTDSDWINIANAISVTNLDENIASKTVNVGSITLFFTQSLENDKQYTISMGEIKSIEGLNIVPLASYTFTTQNVITRNITINIVSDESNIYDKENSIYKVNPIFTIDIGNESLSDEEKGLIANCINISNVDSDSVTKNWDKGKLTIGFNKNLAASNSYTISMNDIDGLKGIDIDFEPLSFTTLATLTFTLTPDDGNVFVTTPTELYICQPNFTITPSFTLNESDRNAIANAVTIDNFADNKLTKSWEDNKLKIGFSSNLSYNATYTLSMNDIQGLDGIIYVPCASFTFTTKDGFNIVMASDDGDVFVTQNGNDLYQTLPTFIATTNMPMSAEDKEKITNSITVSNIDPTKVSLVWNDDYTLVLSFTENLATETDYTISMADIDEIEGVPITGAILSNFRTIDNLSFNSAPSNDSVYAAMSPKFRCNPEFLITPNYSLNDDNKTAIANAISVTNAEGVTKIWDGDSLKITFSQPLAPDSAHSISMGAVNITGVSISPFEPIDFTTVATLTFALTADDGNVFVSTPTELYNCHPNFTITPGFAVNDSDKEIIANAVSINNNASERMTKTWNGNILNIGFSPDLDYNTSYTILMNAIDGIDGVPVTTPDSVSFTTMNGLTINAASNDDNVFITLNEVPLYKTLATFTITTNMVLSDENKDKIYNAVSVSNVDYNNISKTWSDDTTLTLGFKGNLATGTEYSISLAAIQDMNGVSIPASTLYSFRTMDSLSFTVTPDEGSIYTAIDQKYHLRPSFTVTPNYTLTDADRTTVLEAVSVSNADNVTKEWEGNELKIAFSSNLAPDSAHSLAISNISSIPGVLVTPFDNLDFTTLATLTFNVVDDADNVYNPPSTQYHCRPAFTITPSFTIKDDDKSKISDAISVTNTGNIISKSWNENTLRIEFNENLATNTAYTLSMAAVQNMDNISIATFTNKTFTTLPALTITLTSNNANTFSAGKYHCRPDFTITPSFTVKASDMALIENAVTITNVEDAIIRKTLNGNYMTLDFTQNIATSTDYTISLSDIDIKGVNVIGYEPFNFTTIPDLLVNIQIVATDSSLIRKSDTYFLTSDLFEFNNKTYFTCKPTFWVYTNIRFNNTIKNKISNAITASGTAAGLLTKGSWYDLYDGHRIELSFSDNIAASTTHSILISDITDIKGVTVKSFSSFDFDTFFFPGEGDNSKPFLIYTPEQLACIDYFPNETFYYRQMEDLDLVSYDNWKPIGSYTTDLRFHGFYYGNNKKISNLVINRPDESYVGLFACAFGSIQNLTLENIDVTGKNYVGCLTGYLYQRAISNVTISNSKASGTNYIGNLSGSAYSSNVSNITITDCEAHGNDFVGGISGNINYGSIGGDINASNITITGNNNVGGVLGYHVNINSLSNITCDHINLTGNSNLGGAIGYSYKACQFNSCSVTNSTITGTGNYVGGFIGYRYYDPATLNNINCNNVSVSGVEQIGGCIGHGEIITSSNITCKDVEVTGNKEVGGCFGLGQHSIFEKCSVIDSEVHSQQDCGGFIGSLNNNSTVYNSRGIRKCFVKNTRVEGNDLNIGGFAGTVINLKTDSSIDSSYIASCTISSANPLADDNYSLSGFVASNSGTISNCYVYGSTVTGKTNYGALVGVNGGTTTLSDCFISEDHDTIVGNPGTNCTITSCHYNVNDINTFKDSKTWSDGNTINGGSTAWSNYDTSVDFPPQISGFPEP